MWLLSLFVQGVRVPTFRDTELRTGETLVSRGFRVPTFWDTELHTSRLNSESCAYRSHNHGKDFEAEGYADHLVSLRGTVAICGSCYVVPKCCERKGAKRPQGGSKAPAQVGMQA